MRKWCLHASLFIFDRIIIKVAGNQDRHKSSVEFDFGPNQTTHFGVTCPWVTKISHFWTWISLKPVGQSWSNLVCSVIGVRESLQKVLGQIESKLWFPWQQKPSLKIKAESKQLPLISQLPVVTKEIKRHTKNIKNKPNIQFYKWPSSYQSVTYCYQRL